MDDPGLDEGFFDVVEAGHDSVVVLDDEFQGDHLTAVSISFFEDFLGCFGDTSVELFQIFDFSQEANQNRVKVDLQESVFFVFAAFVVANQEVFEFFMSVLINFFLPKTNFGFFIVIDDLEDILMQFLNIFVFFSFGDAFAQVVDFLEGFWDSGLEGPAPGESTSDWGIIVVNRRFLVVSVDEDLAFQENGLNRFQIRLIHVEENCVFLFKFILDDGSVEDAFEAI